MAKIIDQFSVQNYMVLILDRDIPMSPHNTYIIDGMAYKPAPFHARPLTDRIIMNILAIRATGDFLEKKVAFEMR